MNNLIEKIEESLDILDYIAREITFNSKANRGIPNIHKELLDNIRVLICNKKDLDNSIALRIKNYLTELAEAGHEDASSLLNNLPW